MGTVALRRDWQVGGQGQGRCKAMRKAMRTVALRRGWQGQEVVGGNGCVLRISPCSLLTCVEHHLQLLSLRCWPSVILVCAPAKLATNLAAGGFLPYCGRRLWVYRRHLADC